MPPIVTVCCRRSACSPLGSPEALVRLKKRGTPTIRQIFCNELRIVRVSSERRCCCRGDAHEPIFVRCSNRDRVMHERK